MSIQNASGKQTAEPRGPAGNRLRARFVVPLLVFGGIAGASFLKTRFALEFERACRTMLATSAKAPWRFC